MRFLTREAKAQREEISSMGLVRACERKGREVHLPFRSLEVLAYRPVNAAKIDDLMPSRAIIDGMGKCGSFALAC